MRGFPARRARSRLGRRLQGNHSRRRPAVVQACSQPFWNRALGAFRAAPPHSAGSSCLRPPAAPTNFSAGLRQRWLAAQCEE
uniref:Uncharacterized protein n=1 Tax=Setaria viridis TaxID=4556 RepID=A0A4U6ULE5_SETVI|nr:hypothetical protein SEVIR_5G267700v2 [Setaria viridis]TKW15966.1 hypothetical protein SEVIR_5G267700v2 [Setaria viridis]TKW15967.1 hypothetical protein SEVIR_5G267700v2 [Setaria viridis]